MNKLSKICAMLIVLILLMSAAFGVVTKNSYKEFEEDVALVDKLIIENSESWIKHIEGKKVKKQLKKLGYIFLVTATSSERVFRGTKTILNVERVIKGDINYSEKTIALYESAFTNYSKVTEVFLFRSMNNLSIGMQPGRRYLVFADKVEYAQEYKETLPYDEFIVDWDYYMYYFPIDSQIKPIEPKDNLTYGDIKNFDYICFNEKDADKLERIKNSVLDEYLNEE